MSSRFLCAAAAAAIALAAAPALAQPAEIPIQGTLTDDAGTPLQGNHTAVFSLYGSQSSGDALFSETHSVSVDQGAFTVYLGSIDSLDMGVFDGAKLYVGIRVGSDAEMSPRLPIGSVPYAAYAKETAAVPAGAVMHFALDSCPAGWAPLAAARGRAIVGVVEGGELEAAVGEPLGDREDRSHTHAVSATIAANSGQHTHSVTVPAHGHIWGRFTSGNQWQSRVAADGDFVNIGTGQPSLASPLDPANAMLRRAIGLTADFHTSLEPARTLGTGTSGGHTHAVSAQAGAATTGEVMPYLQLLTCIKT
jgi:hypothetical protein